jgi:chorismate synthase
VVTALAAVIGAAVRVAVSGALEDGAGSVVFSGITGAIAAAVITIAAFVAWQGLSTARRAHSTTSP